jgi:hypothetical protein
MFFESSGGNTDSHESLHQLGIEHSSMPADGGELEYKDVKHMGDSY